MTEAVDPLNKYTHAHFDSIEAQIRAKRETHAGKMESIADDAHARPGYFHVSYFNRFSFNPERRAWVKAADEAVRKGMIKRDFRGRFWPVSSTAFNHLEMAYHLLCGYADLFKLLVWCAAFVGLFLGTMTVGPLMIVAYGALGYVSIGVGIFATFVVAGCAYKIVYNG